MSENALTRRGFLATSAGVLSAAALSGYVGFEAWERAYADDADEKNGTVSVVHSLCNGCSNKCGFAGYVVDGRLHKMIGDEAHPTGKGKLCARGYAYANIAYDKDRLTDPLKKNERGEFEAITWEEAFEEIGAQVKDILADKGPSALAIVEDPRPSGDYYSRRFMNALGSANIYTHAAACNLSCRSGAFLAIGANEWSSDIAHSKMTMFIGRSYADGIRPAQITAMQNGFDTGAHIVIVDPRYSNSQRFADEWVPIKPGTDLALVLAMSNVIVSEERYDTAFIEAYGEGFEEYAATVREYTPEWAASKTGIDAVTIRRLALEMANAAPACSIVAGWRGPSGCQYKNSGELGRAVALFNALLGTYGAKGGSKISAKFAAGKLDAGKFPSVPKPEVKQVGADEYPLARTNMGSALAAAKAAHEGKLSGMFFYNCNMVGGYANPAYLSEAVESLPLSVCIDVQMSETAMACQYVLPDTSYLERDEVPAFNGGSTPSVSLRSKVIEVVHPNTKPCDEIFTGLAKACGVGQYFEFTVQELAQAQLASVGVDYEAAKRIGTVGVPQAAPKASAVLTWGTPSGKVMFANQKCVDAGLTAAPSWIEPEVMPYGNELRLIEAKQPIHSHTMTANNEFLMSLTHRYDLTRAWISVKTAESLGVSEGDEIEISNTQHTGRIRAHVTNRIVDSAIYLPSAYGRNVKDQHTADGVGLCPADFVKFQIEPAYGSAMSHEACVTVKKVGA